MIWWTSSRRRVLFDSRWNCCLKRNYCKSQDEVTSDIDDTFNTYTISEPTNVHTSSRLSPPLEAASQVHRRGGTDNSDLFAIRKWNLKSESKFEIASRSLIKMKMELARGCRDWNHVPFILVTHGRAILHFEWWNEFQVEKIECLERIISFRK